MNLKTLSILLCILFGINTTHAQFLKKLKKKAEKAAERAIERKVEEKSERETEKTFDTLFNKKRKNKRKRRRKNNKHTSETSNEQTSQAEKETHKVSTNFDFKAGNVMLFQDDYSQDNIGDFPAKWDTDGGGELTNINGQKYLKMQHSAVYVPMMSEKLPENYTVEFDLYAPTLNKKTSSHTWVYISIDDNNTFKEGKNYGRVGLNPCQYIVSSTWVNKKENGKEIIKKQLKLDYRAVINGKSRVSIMVNKSRFRLWLNERKLIDVPRLIPIGKASYLKLMQHDYGGNVEMYFGNVRIAKTGQDRRSTLLETGTFTTNEILFESGKSIIKSSSEKIIQELVTELNTSPNTKVQIIGHTDSDGSAETNLELSRQRAYAVKEKMIKLGISNYERLFVEGKGETEPLASNSSSHGKAQNRRVEFKIIK